MSDSRDGPGLAARPQRDLKRLRLNETVLVDYWENRIFTDELLRRLQRLP